MAISLALSHTVDTVWLLTSVRTEMYAISWMHGFTLTKKCSIPRIDGIGGTGSLRRLGHVKCKGDAD